VAQSKVVFLLDVDNTLLDNDRVIGDLRRHLACAVGRRHEQRYWKIFEELRAQLGYADYLGALCSVTGPNTRAMSESFSAVCRLTGGDHEYKVESHDRARA
jgi:hypothetical protein